MGPFAKAFCHAPRPDCGYTAPPHSQPGNVSDAAWVQDPGQAHEVGVDGDLRDGLYDDALAGPHRRAVGVRGVVRLSKACPGRPGMLHGGSRIGSAECAT